MGWPSRRSTQCSSQVSITAPCGRGHCDVKPASSVTLTEGNVLDTRNMHQVALRLSADHAMEGLMLQPTAERPHSLRLMPERILYCYSG